MKVLGQVADAVLQDLPERGNLAVIILSIAMGRTESEKSVIFVCLREISNIRLFARNQ